MIDRAEKSVTFRAELVPHRSLSPTGFTILMAIVAGVSFIAGVVFLMIGAWPVVGFFGLDVALIYGAFKLNFRDSERREIVEVGDHDVVVTKLFPGKPPRHLTFHRSWLQIELEEDAERELIGPLLLRERGKSFEIGGFLSPDDRKDFCQALKGAVAAVRI
ncbi:MAG: DUF2244 domain-containing protein [Rhizobiales bacterium]|nr:DUF2244 domain-containing protein [Hyphomicrobiales bacterium]